MIVSFEEKKKNGLEIAFGDDFKTSERPNQITANLS